jgi:hypothetical protein
MYCIPSSSSLQLVETTSRCGRDFPLALATFRGRKPATRLVSTIQYLCNPFGHLLVSHVCSPDASPLRLQYSIGKSDFLLLGDVLDANAAAPLQARDLWRGLSQGGGTRRLLPHNRFPLLLLSYADHLELADAVAYAASQLPEVVLVFAPVFLLGERRRLDLH